MVKTLQDTEHDQRTKKANPLFHIVVFVRLTEAELLAYYSRYKDSAGKIPETQEFLKKMILMDKWKENPDKWTICGFPAAQSSGRSAPYSGCAAPGIPRIYDSQIAPHPPQNKGSCAFPV